MSQTINRSDLFNDGWVFARGEPDDAAPPETFVPVDLPHDWLIGDAENLYRDGTLDGTAEH